MVMVIRSFSVVRDSRLCMQSKRYVSGADEKDDEAKAKSFGAYLRGLREQRRKVNRRYSVRQTAERIGVEPTPPQQDRAWGNLPARRKIRCGGWRPIWGEDADLLLARAGLVASDVLEVIAKRPTLFAEIIRGLGDVSRPGVVRLGA
jgi:hypothetical protein